MKNILLALFSITLLQLKVRAQVDNPYKNATAFSIIIKDNSLLKGISFKRLFGLHTGIESGILFNRYHTKLYVEYQYIHSLLAGIGLKWYCGIGPSLDFNRNHMYDEFGDYVILKRTMNWSLVPFMGTGWKIGQLPLDLSMDWGPVGLVSSRFEFNTRQARLSIHYIF